MTDHRARLEEFLVSAGARPGAAGEFDSLVLLQIVTWLEENYGIRLSGQDVEADDLRSVAGILSIIERFNHAAGAGTN